MNNTKKYIRILFSGIMIIILLAGCDEEPGLTPGSNLNPPPASDDALDLWIQENYVDSFNIEVVYSWQESLVDQSRYLYPPHKDSVQSVLEFVKALWIEPYNRVAGKPFVQELKPSQLVLVGGRNLNPAGTITLGLAEAGKRITLFEVNLIDKSDSIQVNRFMQTVHHEYAHILEQSRPFNEEVWGEITPEGYTAQWFNESDRGSQEEGFISAYARSNENEDFAEMVAYMLTTNREQWNELIDITARDTEVVTMNGIPVIIEGRPQIREVPEERNRFTRAEEDLKAKEQLVFSYYRDEYGLDIYVLQDSIYNATQRAIRR
ncbi:MAG: putative zinc-binding metallopeptidase [Ekhidna sp.]|nr:putative zinc-binding metallopeptidase [Ekhidna sp.]